MSKSTEDLLRDLEASGVLDNKKPGAVAPPPTGAPAPRKTARAEEGDTPPSVLLIMAAIVVAVIGSLPLIDFALYPFALLVTLIHETFHAVTASISGGSVASLQISPNLSGLTRISGGWTPLVASAGYLGAAATGAALLLIPLRYARWAIAGLAVFPLMALVLFHPADVFTALACVVFTAALGASAWKLRPRYLGFLQILLGVEAGLNAFRDLIDLIFSSGSGSHIHTDATAMSHALIFPSIVWAFIWAIVSTALLVGSVAWLLRKDVRRLRGRRGSTAS